MKYTSGPWKIYTTNDSIVIESNKESQIAVLGKLNNASADAKLIAAAPELLEALDWLVKNSPLQSFTDCEAENGNLDKAYERAKQFRALISKAQGESK